MKRYVPALALLLPMMAAAHAVPDDVRVAIYLKPEGNHLRILARVPADAMIDILFPMQPGDFYIDGSKSGPELADAARLWVSDLLAIDENGARLPKPRIVQTLLSYGSDTSFASWQEALAHVTGPKLPPSALLAWNRAMVDVLLDAPIRSDRSDFSFTPRFGRIGVRVTTTVTFLPPAGAARTYIYEGDPEPYHLNPSWGETAAHFFRIGFTHIRTESDHLVLLFCVVVLFRRFRALLPFAISFAVAHTLALVGAALGVIPIGLWFGPAIGILIAITVIYVALESVVRGASARMRQAVAIAGGVAFGYGFWFFLTPLMQFSGAHPAIAMAAFDAGIETSQFLALAIIVPLVSLMLRFVFLEQAGTIVLAAIAAHIAWHRMVERAYALSQYSVQWPILNPAAALLPMLLTIVIAMAFWTLYTRLRPRRTV